MRLLQNGKKTALPLQNTILGQIKLSVYFSKQPQTASVDTSVQDSMETQSLSHLIYTQL